MTVESALKSMIVGDKTGVYKERVYQPNPPANTTMPFVSFRSVTERKYRHSRTWETVYQVDAVAETFAQAMTASDRVMLALDDTAFTGVGVQIHSISLKSRQKLFDGNLHFIAMSFDVAYRET